MFVKPLIFDGDEGFLQVGADLRELHRQPHFTGYHPVHDLTLIIEQNALLRQGQELVDVRLRSFLGDLQNFSSEIDRADQRDQKREDDQTFQDFAEDLQTGISGICFFGCFFDFLSHGLPP